MKPDLMKAILGGVAGTAVMTAMMMFVAPMMTGQPMDIAMLIGNMTGAGYMFGMMVHIVMGVIIFPLVYAYVVFHFVPGSPTVRGNLWGVALWLVAATVIMPMAGAGFFMANIGGMMAAMAALLGHMVYGAILGMITGVNRIESSYQAGE